MQEFRRGDYGAGLLAGVSRIIARIADSIRSPRAGKVSAVFAAAGQIVTHKQTLVEFA